MAHKKEEITWDREYIDGHLHGRSVTFFAGGRDRVASVTHYSRGKKEGEATFYNKEGARVALLRYVQGAPQGEHEFYFDNTKLKTVLTYNRGLLEKVVLYYPSGTKQREIFLKEGKRHGADCFWEEDGTLRFHVEYEMGKQVLVQVEDPILKRYFLT